MTPDLKDYDLAVKTTRRTLVDGQNRFGYASVGDLDRYSAALIAAERAKWEGEVAERVRAGREQMRRECVEAVRKLIRPDEGGWAYPLVTGTTNDAIAAIEGVTA